MSRPPPSTSPSSILQLSMLPPQVYPPIAPAPSPPPPPPPSRTRNNPTGFSRNRSNLKDMDVIIPPPFPWATNRRAKIDTLESLLSKGIRTITGEVQCKKCEHRCALTFDLESKFREIGSYIRTRDFYERAPTEWMNPTLPACPSCNQPSCLKPVIPSDKTLINWLFLLLGQMLGCCTLEQLKFFCQHNLIHRTGAKNRLLYYTYLALCKQLDHTGPFDR